LKDNLPSPTHSYISCVISSLEGIVKKWFSSTSDRDEDASALANQLFDTIVKPLLNLVIQSSMTNNLSIVFNDPNLLVQIGSIISSIVAYLNVQ